MQLVLHTGSHFTEEGRVLKCLLRNKDRLRELGTTVPGPSRYRDLLRETLNAMQNAAPSPQARDILLEAISEDEASDRVVLSHPHLFAWPRGAIRRGQFYPQAAERLARMSYIFSDDDIELFMAVRNPATFIPKCFERSPRPTVEGFMAGFDPRDLRWSDTFSDIRQAVPDMPITVWCNEDAPLLWSQIIRDMAGLEHGEYITGRFDLAKEIMTQDGSERLASYLESKPEMTEIHVRRVIAAFLEHYAIPEKINEEIDLPGFTSELVSELTELYEDDLEQISRIPGVDMISL